MKPHEIQTPSQIVAFRIQHEEFGIDINLVREIVPLLDITHIPSASQALLLGVINLRGQIIPIIDLSNLLGFSTQSMTSKTSRIVVAELDKTIVGMIVDEVPHVLKIAKEDLLPPPELIQQKKTMHYIHGIGRLGDRLIFILDLIKLLQPHEKMIREQKEENNG